MFPTAAISGEAKNNSYCQTLTSGNFIIVIFLQGQSFKREMELGRNILSKIEEQTVQAPEISPSEIVEMQMEQFSTSVELNLMVVKIESQKIFLCARGKVEAKLIRQGKLINLFQETEAIKAVNGPLLHNDLVIFGTSDLFLSLSPPELLQLNSLSVEEIKEQLIPKVETASEKEKICAVFSRIGLITQSTPIPAPVSGISAGNALWNFKRQSFENPSSKRTLYLILIVFVFIVSFIAFQLRSKNLETNVKNIATIETVANEGIGTAGKLIGLNDQIARDLLSQTRKEVVTQIEKAYGTDWQKKDSSDRKKLDEILTKIDEQIGKVSHIYQVTQLDKFYDFSLMKSGPRIVSWNLHGGKIVSLDNANGAIYSLMTNNKAAELIAGNKELKNARFLDFTPEILFVQTPSGIFQKKLDGSDEFRQIIKPSDKLGEFQGLSAFGGNLYVLDPKNNQIWKYQGTDLGFSDLVNYIKTDLPVDISNGTAMNIDGFIYVLTNGQIARFAGGDVSNFTFSGLPDPLLKVTSFFTSDETKNVYLWDEKDNKVVIVDKEGTYQAEYKLADIAKRTAVRGILADEGVKKIFLLSDSMVFSIDIK